jgi:hypothetical protein
VGERKLLRIWQNESEAAAVAVRLEGRLGGRWVGELERVLEALLAQGKRIELNLSDVVFLDERGIRFIRKCSSRGVSVTTSSPFVAAQLAESDEWTEPGRPKHHGNGERIARKERSDERES